MNTFAFSPGILIASQRERFGLPRPAHQASPFTGILECTLSAMGMDAWAVPESLYSDNVHDNHYIALNFLLILFSRNHRGLNPPYTDHEKQQSKKKSQAKKLGLAHSSRRESGEVSGKLL